MKFRTLILIIKACTFISIVYGCRKIGNDNNGFDSIVDTVYIERINVDTIYVNDTIVKIIFTPKEELRTFILQPPAFDSVETQSILMNSLWSGKIETNFNNSLKELYPRGDLEYLPYLLQECIDYDRNGQQMSQFNMALYITMCTEAIDDKELFAQGKTAIETVNYCNRNSPKFGFPVEYPKEFVTGGPWTYRDFIWFSPNAIDTLRIQAISYNNRDALDKLETYYKDKGDDTGIAIYYKVMLGYEGNGDLAEKFFKVLEPHFKETPGFRKAAREVLLRAALCDKNKRAQELCDSLGFSLCDYRLPIVDK